MRMVGVKLTKLLSHVDTSQHLNLACALNCSDNLCVVLDGRSALFPSGKYALKCCMLKVPCQR